MHEVQTAKQQKYWRRTGGEARWEVDELLQELADAELGKQAMVTVGVAVTKMEHNFNNLEK